MFTESPNAMDREAGRLVIHVGEPVVQLGQAGRYHMWVSRASFYIMSGLRPLGPRPITLKTHNKFTSTFCHPSHHQPPQHQSIPHLSIPQAPHQPRLSSLPTWSPLVMSHPGPTVAGVCQAKTLPDPISPNTARGDLSRVATMGNSRKWSGGTRGFQGDVPKNN